jgi:hypothetical protein
MLGFMVRHDDFSDVQLLVNMPHVRVNRADADSQFVSNLFGPITTRQEFQNFRCLKVAVEASRQVLNNESIDLSALY